MTLTPHASAAQRNPVRILAESFIPRGAGHSFAMLKVAKELDAIVIVVTQEQKSRYTQEGIRCVLLSQLPEAIYGQHRPILVDHFAYYGLAQQVDTALTTAKQAGRAEGRALLRKYGAHRGPGCADYMGDTTQPCQCGLDAALQEPT